MLTHNFPACVSAQKFAPLKVLVVDDHCISAVGMRHILASAGLDVVGTVYDPKAARQMLRDAQIDVVVLDVLMPHNEGVDLLVELPTLAPAVAAVVYSTLPSEMSAGPLLRMGARAYVEKRAPLAYLIDEVKNAGTTTRSPAGVRQGIYRPIRRSKPCAGAAPALIDPDFSSREFQVLLRLASGDSVGHIANVLGVSGVTVSTYRARILKKLALKSNAQLTYFALRTGLMNM